MDVRPIWRKLWYLWSRCELWLVDYNGMSTIFMMSGDKSSTNMAGWMFLSECIRVFLNCILQIWLIGLKWKETLSRNVAETSCCYVLIIDIQLSYVIFQSLFLLIMAGLQDICRPLLLFHQCSSNRICLIDVLELFQLIVSRIKKSKAQVPCWVKQWQLLCTNVWHMQRHRI